MQLRAHFPLFYASRLLFDARAECLLLGFWRRRVSAHELSRWRLRAPAVDADANAQAYASAYELRPVDTLLPDAAGLCFDALLATATARSPRRLDLFDLVFQYSLYSTLLVFRFGRDALLCRNTVLVVVNALQSYLKCAIWTTLILSTT